MEITKRPYAENSLRLSTSPFFKVVKRDDVKKYLKKQVFLVKPEANESDLKTIRSVFSCTNNEASSIYNFWYKRKASCSICFGKHKNCYHCALNDDSDAKRDLFVSLQNIDLKPELNYRINTNGSFYASPKAIDFDNILAIPDLFINLGFKKLCIFIDTNSTKTAGLHAKSIRNKLMDHMLTKLGYVVYRCNSAHINKNCDAIMLEITAKIIKKKTAESPRMKRLKTILG